MAQTKKDNKNHPTPKKAAAEPAKKLTKGYEKPRVEKREKLADVTAEPASGPI